MEARVELKNFLEIIGYPEQFDTLIQNGITTKKALSDLDVGDLNQIFPTVVSRRIHLAIHSSNNSGEQSTSGPTSSTSSTSNQDNLQSTPQNQIAVVVEFQNKLLMAQLQSETEIKFLQMKAEIEKLKLQNEFEKEKQKLIQDANKKESDQKLELFMKEAEGNAKIAKVQFDGEKKLLEEKLKNATSSPSTVIPGIPPGWDMIWGPYQYFGMCGSTILTNFSHFGMIQSWLGTPRVWTLRYRGTRDGFNSNNFHARCDNVGPTVTLIRVGSYIFGGYNPNSWNTTSGYTSGYGPFIFTLVNPYGKQAAFYPKTSTNTIYNHTNYGPTFGAGHDIYVSTDCSGNSNSYSNFPNTYNDTLGHGNNTFTGTRNWCPNEVEVFNV
eukprot:TRINITY_DN6534_c0_g3_i3.p1 TRINITY_DN6534_c0_g3~~TRINITY_DN6534_c0_g3_i3.p1  ORF type:complete len:381 (-),score=111.30 TRINITY_DN6534_c0_g3_i3:100-1242(-)